MAFVSILSLFIFNDSETFGFKLLEKQLISS
jgi:hypothetical protein